MEGDDEIDGCVAVTVNGEICVLVGSADMTRRDLQQWLDEPDVVVSAISMRDREKRFVRGSDVQIIA